MPKKVEKLFLQTEMSGEIPELETGKIKYKPDTIKSGGPDYNRFSHQIKNRHQSLFYWCLYLYSSLQPFDIPLHVFQRNWFFPVG